MDWRVELRFGVFWQGEAVELSYGQVRWVVARRYRYVGVW